VLGNLSTLKSDIFKEKWHYLLGILALIACDGLQLFEPWIIGLATDELASGTSTTARLLGYGGLILVIAVGVALMRYGWRIKIVVTAIKIEEKLRNRLFGHFQKLSPNYYSQARSGDLMARATNDLSAVRELCGFGVIILVDMLFVGITTFIIMVRIDLKLTLYVLLPLFAISLVVSRFNPSLKKRFLKVQESFADLTEKTRENFAGMRVVKAYVQEEAEVEKFREASQDYFEKNMRLIKLRRVFEPILMILANSAVLLVLLLGGTDVILAKISVGTFVAFWIYLMMLRWPMVAVGMIIPFFQRADASMGRINEVLEAEPEIKDSPEAIEIPALRGDIEFRNLTYTYPSADRPSLRNINLKIEPGSTLAIVGKIGSGKSTLANMISRMLEPEKDCVYIDDKEITGIKLMSLRRQVAAVPQTTFLFASSIKDNIAFSDTGMDLAEVSRAAQTAQIHDQVMSFPGQYDTIVGERGVTLSGGEKQRVAIARAVAADPKILVLDDCLSAVDAHTEEKILKGMQEVLKKRTAVIISHRISSIQHADHIIVLDDGCIVEQGKHVELLRINGIYAEMYRKQQLEQEIMNASEKEGGVE